MKRKAVALALAASLVIGSVPASGMELEMGTGLGPDASVTEAQAEAEEAPEEDAVILADDGAEAEIVSEEADGAVEMAAEPGDAAEVTVESVEAVELTDAAEAMATADVAITKASDVTIAIEGVSGKLPDNSSAGGAAEAAAPISIPYNPDKEDPTKLDIELVALPTTGGYASLTNGTDYDLDYTGIKGVGANNVLKITFKSARCNKITTPVFLKFTITQKGLNEADVTKAWNAIPELGGNDTFTFTYDGTSQKAKVKATVKYKGHTLAEGTDYEIKVYNDTAEDKTGRDVKATASDDLEKMKFKVEGIGNYTGVAKESNFTIKQKAIAANDIDVPDTSFYKGVFTEAELQKQIKDNLQKDNGVSVILEAEDMKKGSTDKYTIQYYAITKDDAGKETESSTKVAGAQATDRETTINATAGKKYAYYVIPTNLTNYANVDGIGSAEATKDLTKDQKKKLADLGLNGILTIKEAVSVDTMTPEVLGEEVASEFAKKSYWYTGKDQFGGSDAEGIWKDIKDVFEAKFGAGIMDNLVVVKPKDGIKNADTYNVTIQGKEKTKWEGHKTKVSITVKPMKINGTKAGEFNSALNANGFKPTQGRNVGGTAFGHDVRPESCKLTWVDSAGKDSLEEGKAYELKMADRDANGKIATVTVNGIGNFEGSVTVPVTQDGKIKLNELKDSAKVKVEGLGDDGLVELGDIEIKDKGGTIIQAAGNYEIDTGSTCSKKDGTTTGNTSVDGNLHKATGSHTVTIKAVANSAVCEGTLTITFVIGEAAFNSVYEAVKNFDDPAVNATIKTTDANMYPHNKAYVVNKNDSADRLVVGTHYSWEYVYVADPKVKITKDDIAQGLTFKKVGDWKLVLTATDTLAGGKYTGSLEIPFKVVPKEFKPTSITAQEGYGEGTNISIPWQGKAITDDEFAKALKVMDDTTELKYKESYDIVKVEGRDKVGTAKVTLTGAEGSNYKYDANSTVTVDVKITAKSLAAATVKAADGVLDYTGDAEYIGKLDADDAVVVLEGETLSPEEYTAEFKAEGNKTDVNTPVTIIVKAKDTGNYSGNAGGSGVIAKADLSNGKVFSLENVADPVYLYSGDAKVEQKDLKLKDLRTEKYVEINPEYAYDGDVTKAGKATVKVSAAEAVAANYTGVASKEFTVEEAGPANVELTQAEFTYTGKAITDVVKAVKNADGTELKKEAWTAQYSDNTNVGTATVTVTVKTASGATLTKDAKFEIVPAVITEKNVEGVKDSYEFTGKVIRPQFEGMTVTVNGTKLTEGTDYVVYNTEDDKNVGTMYVAVSGKGNYKGDFRIAFEVTKATIKAEDVKGVKASYKYTGEAVNPNVKVVVNGKTLKKGTDYDVTGAGQVNVGTAKLVITGKGSYTGSVEKAYEVKAATLAGAKVKVSNVKYNGKVKKPAATVTLGGKTLVKGTDYTVKYTNDAAIGLKAATVTGKGNYKGSVVKTFKVEPAKAAVKSVAVGTKKLTVTVKSQSGAKYQIQYRVKGTSKWTSVNSGTAKKVLKSLKSGKQYQVRVRAYATINGSRTNGAWSAAKLSGAVK